MMGKNYLKIAIRNLQRHKSYTFINVTGLAVGMACCLLILLFVRDELSYDRFHENADRIYRIESDWGDFSLPATNPPTVRRLKTDYPQIKVGHFLTSSELVRYEDQVFREPAIGITNPEIFEIFTIPILRGDVETVLNRPYTTVITEQTAKKYFGNDDPIGKKLLVANQMEVEVTGLMQSLPPNAHFHFDFLVSWATVDDLYDYSNSERWANNSIYTYLHLPPGYPPEALEAQFPDFIARHAGDNWNGSILGLQKLTDIHLRSRHNMELEPNSNIVYVYVFSIIALFILLLACINFMNLTTARSVDRAKEVGVRKVVGAQRKQLILQFLTETMLLSFLSLFLTIALVRMVLPTFRTLSGKAIAFSLLNDIHIVFALLAITVIVGLLSGSYPAFMLSSFNPVRALKDGQRKVAGGALLRKGLVVFQFAISTILMAGTMIVYNQLEYLRSVGLGFDKEQVLSMPIQDGSLLTQYAAFKQTLLQESSIRYVSVSSEGLPGELLDATGFRLEGAPEDSTRGLRTVSVGHDFIEVLGAEMMVGRSFSEEFATDSSAYIVNESGYRLLSSYLPETPTSPVDVLGMRVRGFGNLRSGQLIGIVKDFNISSLHESIEPVAFYITSDDFSYFLVQIDNQDPSETIATIERVWKNTFPNWPFEFSFVDDDFDAQYRAEERLGQIISVFSVLAVFIACLGLFGLVAYMAERRTKEIGVRKILGASVPGIVFLLSRDFTRLVLIALVVAIPTVYFTMQRWLDGFAYRIAINWHVFLLAGLMALGIALMTVSYQALKAAFSDPVKALRYE